MNYLQWIDEQINKHQTEIARLTVARSVIQEAVEVIKVKPVREAKPKRGKQKFAKGKTRDWIIAVMKTMHPAPSGEVTRAVLQVHPELTEKAVWNALYNARLVGAVIRDENKIYSLPETLTPSGEQAA